MDIIKRNAETLKVLGGMAAGLITCSVWINSQFAQINQRMENIENRLIRIETVLVMRGIMPQGLAMGPKEEGK